MKNKFFKIFIFVIIIVLLLAVILFLYPVCKENKVLKKENKLKDKIMTEISYNEENIIDAMNKLNNINIVRYKIYTEQINSANVKGKANSTSNTSGDGQKENQQESGNGQSGGNQTSQQNSQNSQSGENQSDQQNSQNIQSGKDQTDQQGSQKGQSGGDQADQQGSQNSQSGGNQASSQGSENSQSSSETSNNNQSNSSQMKSNNNSSNNSDSKIPSEKYGLQYNNSLTENNETNINWENIEYIYENIFIAWQTMQVDLTDQKVSSEIINKYNSDLNGIANSIIQQNKESTMINYFNLYADICDIVKYISKENNLLNLYYAKLYLLNAYTLSESKKWNEMYESVANSESYFKNSYNEKTEGSSLKDINQSKYNEKIAMSLSNLKDSINLNDKSIFYIQYKNVMQMLCSY